jgi:hypothetical protein
MDTFQYIVKVNNLFVEDIDLIFDNITFSKDQKELELTVSEIEWIQTQFPNAKFYKVTKNVD